MAALTTAAARVLAVNAGSSSVKLSVIGDGDAPLLEAELGAPGAPGTEADLLAFIEGAGDIDASAHRLVHGGPRLRHAVVVDAEVRELLDTAAAIAPLHVPAALHLLDVVLQHVHVPAIACFDTSFHARMPAAASTYAIPEEWRGGLGVQRYGFHGLSCAWSLRAAATELRRDVVSLQLIVAHLGGGASVTAVRDGHGVDTTMGFTPLEGLVMGTRSGTVDPGALLWLQTAQGVTAAQLSDALETRSGLVALAGTASMRDVLRRASDGDSSAQLAREVFVHRVRAAVGAMAMSLDCVDALVFTGGIGEHEADIRDRVCAGLAPLQQREPLRVLTVHAREDLQMAAETRPLLSRG